MSPSELERLYSRLGTFDNSGLRPPAASPEQLLCEIAHQLANLNIGVRHLAHSQEEPDPLCQLCTAAADRHDKALDRQVKNLKPFDGINTGPY